MAVGANFPEVLRAAQLGAEWAWRTLYKDLAPAVTGYLRLHNVREPDDLTGEVFVHVVRGLANFAGDEKQFRSWVFVIAHHRVCDERRLRARKPLEPAADNTIQRLGSSGNSEDEALHGLATAEVCRVLESLSNDQRDVMLLRIIGGFTLEETAGMIGKRALSVKALQRRAIATIRRKGLVRMADSPAQLSGDLGFSASAGR
jgi:RNA polymerase sigma-70 factor (ECF subfamily)